MGSGNKDNTNPVFELAKSGQGYITTHGMTQKFHWMIIDWTIYKNHSLLSFLERDSRNCIILSYIKMSQVILLIFSQQKTVLRRFPFDRISIKPWFLLFCKLFPRLLKKE